MIFLSMGVAFALGLIGAILAILAVFVVLAVISAFFVSAVLLVSGIVIKCVNIKLGWRNFKIYSTILLIWGGVYTVMNIIYAVFAVTSLNIFQ